MNNQTNYLKQIVITLCAIMLLSNCSKDIAFEKEKDSRDVLQKKGKIIHHVSVGGADICISFNEKPGCNANFSLVANMDAEGNVKGEYHDQFQNGDGFHAKVNCLTVDGNNAWISGIVTSGVLEGTDLTGLPVITRVQDNGSKGDKISYSYLGSATLCSVRPNIPLLDMTGQVVVR